MTVFINRSTNIAPRFLAHFIFDGVTVGRNLDDHIYFIEYAAPGINTIQIHGIGAPELDQYNVDQNKVDHNNTAGGPRGVGSQHKTEKTVARQCEGRQLYLIWLLHSQFSGEKSALPGGFPRVVCSAYFTIPVPRFCRIFFSAESLS
jgi:hypothetical protein